MLPAALLDALEALSAVGARPTDVAWFPLPNPHSNREPASDRDTKAGEELHKLELVRPPVRWVHVAKFSL